MKPKISIITVSYNSAATLEQTISSVVNQTYPDIEYIVIDGGSTDGTVDIIKKYADRIAYWVSEPDHGIYEAMNKGIRAATGDYVEIIGSDDCLAGPRAIEGIVHHFADAPDILSCWEYCVFGDTGYQSIYKNDFARDKARYKGDMVPHGAMFARRKLFDKYPFDESYRIVSDYKFFLQCYYDPEVTIKYVDDLVVFFEVDAGGASADIEACQKEDAKVYRELGLPFDDAEREKERRPSYKKAIKAMTDAMGATKAIKRFLNHHFRWEKHHCDNAICRWCHRGI